MKTKIFAIIFLLAANALISFAQGLNVRGTVRDTHGDPVTGAVVMLQGSTTVATVTDAKGTWALSLPAGSKDAVLVFSCISFADRVEQVAGRGVIDVVLEDDTETLEEVVVVGYGAMRRSDLTGSVASVRIDDDNAAKSSTLDQMLDGRAAGIQVLSDSGSPDAGVTIRVRGIASFTGNTDPLYVVDGVIVGGSSNGLATMQVGTSNNAQEETNGLAGINPQDIASIEILKDASATAIYGSRGANGVVLITTKQATKDIPVVRFNSGVSVSETDKRLDILGFDEYVQMLKAYGTSTSEGQLAKLYEDPSTLSGLKVTPIDWQDYIFRTAVSHRYYFSVSGRPKGYNYLFSVGYNHNEGVIRASDSDNLTARLNLEKRVFRRLKLSFKTSVGYVKSNLVTGAVNGGNITSRSSLIRSALRSKPYITINPEEDTEEYDSSATDDINFGPSRWLNGMTNTSERMRVNPSLSADLTLAKWLTFRSTLGADFVKNERIKTKVSRLSVGYGNTAGVGDAKSFRWNWDNLLIADFKKDGHSLSATLGQSASRESYEAQSVTGSFLPQPNAHIHDINNATSDNSLLDTYTMSNSSLMSFFSRLVYNWSERYVLTGTFRFDGSSRFRDSNKWGFFPSFAFAWRIVNEPWFNVPFISNAKLRLGWGQVGNQAISNYQTMATYSSFNIGNHFNDAGKETTLRPSNIGNADLKWETSDQLNAGLDLSFWKGRFTFTADAYQKDTRDLLQNKILPFSTGYSSIAINDGGIRNRGLELTAEAIPLKKGPFEISVGGNISFNRNTVIDVGASGSTAAIFLNKDSSEETVVKYFYGNALQSSGDTNPLNIFIEGYPMGLFYGYVYEGVVQEGEAAPGFTAGTTLDPGCCKYRDLDGNGYIDVADRTIIGNPLPDFTYGLNASVTWKSLTLSMDFSGAYGFDIFNLNNVLDYQNSLNYNMRRDAFINAWTPENKNEWWPALGLGTDNKLSDRYVEDGSYLRLSNLSLSWAVPLNRDTMKVLHGLSVSASVGNLYMWTKYSGFSPSNNSYGTDVKRMGVDLNSGPTPRSFNFDIKLTF